MIGMEGIRFKRPAPRSAATTRPTVPNGNGPLPRARLTQILAPSHTPNLKLLDKLIAEQRAHDASRQNLLTDSAELSKVIAVLQSKAKAEEWSQRELAAKVGLSKSTWHRICKGHVAPAEYLPRLRSAAARLQKGVNTHA